MSKVKKQHYLPQFYLRNFANEKGRICIVDAKLDIPYIVSNVKDVAQGRYYYDFHGDGDNQSIEKMFSLIEGQLATEFKPLLDRAQNRESMTQQDKDAVLRFLKLQFLRSDWMREKIPPDFVKNNFKPEYIDDADKLLHAYMISENMFTEMLDYISNYEMKILYSHPNFEIYTSSFPLFFDHQGSIEELIDKLIKLKSSERPSIDSNLFFPLTPLQTVYIYDPKRPVEFADDAWISSFMTTGLSWASQRIYFREHENSLRLYPMLKPFLNLKGG